MNIILIFIFVTPLFLYSSEPQITPTTIFNMTAVISALNTADQEQARKSDTKHLKSPSRRRTVLFSSSSPYGNAQEWRGQSALRRKLIDIQKNPYVPVAPSPTTAQIKDTPHSDAPCSTKDIENKQ